MGEGAGLRRSLGLPLLTLYGLGNIVGAGIYVLIGKVAGLAGSSTTLSFIIAMVTAGVTALSYMELSGRYPVSASVSVYLHKAFGKRWLSVAIGLAMVVGGGASAAALAQGFAGYLNSFLTVPTGVASVGLLVAIGALAIKGMSESAKTAALFTGLEILGLALVVWFGRSAFARMDIAGMVTVDPAVGISGVFAAIAETGTLMMLSGPQSPASTHLLPETHIAVVAASQIVAHYEDAFARMREQRGAPPRAMNLVSGPSRTGDIEQTIVLGAHGPYRVHLVLVEGE